MEHAIEANGIGIVRTPTGIGVAFVGAYESLDPAHYQGAGLDAPLKVEVDYMGRRWKEEWLSPRGQQWRDYYPGLDMLKCVVRVKQHDVVLAELGPAPSELEIMPFMVLQGEQRHITESFVSVPPALTITDEVGAVWTLGFVTAPKEQSPAGEFAFNILRDGIDTREIASRIERRNGKVRIFTRHGWKQWTGRAFI